MPYQILPPGIDPRLQAYDQALRFQQDQHWRDKGEPKESGAFINAAGALPGAATGLKYGMMTGNPYAAAGMTAAGGIIGHYAGPKRLHPGEGPYAHPGNIQESDQQIMQGAMQLMNAGGSAIAGGMGGGGEGMGADAGPAIGEAGSQYAGPPASAAPQQGFWGRLGDKFSNFDMQGASDSLMDSGQLAPSADYRQRQGQQQQQQRLWYQNQAQLQKKVQQIQTDTPGTWQHRTPADETAWNMWVNRMGVAERNEDGTLSAREQRQVYQSAMQAMRPIAGRMYKPAPEPTIDQQLEQGQTMKRYGNTVVAFKQGSDGSKTPVGIDINEAEISATKALNDGYITELRDGLSVTTLPGVQFASYDKERMGATYPEPDDYLKARKQAVTELGQYYEQPSAAAVTSRAQEIINLLYPQMHGTNPGIDAAYRPSGQRVPVAAAYSGDMAEQVGTGPVNKLLEKMGPFELEKYLSRSDPKEWSPRERQAAQPAAERLWEMLKEELPADATFKELPPNVQSLLLKLHEILKASE